MFAAALIALLVSFPAASHAEIGTIISHPGYKGCGSGERYRISPLTHYRLSFEKAKSPPDSLINTFDAFAISVLGTIQPLSDNFNEIKNRKIAEKCL